MKRINPIPSPKKIEYSENFIPFKLKGARIIGNYGETLTTALSLLNVGINDGANLEIFCGEDHLVADNQEAASFFAKEKFAKKQGYVLTFDGNTVRVIAYTEIGCAYGLMTLKEMFDGEFLPCEFSVLDAPDFLHRANKWLSWCECGIWSYDRGDGYISYEELITKAQDPDSVVQKLKEEMGE